MNKTKVSDLTVDELATLIRGIVDEALENRGVSSLNKRPRKDQRGILDIPPLHLDPRHPALTIISREDMYGDDGR